MNGRVYDPEIGRFLSADPLVQAPYNTQSYNRYSYVFNNPLSFVDPTGYYRTSEWSGEENTEKQEEDNSKRDELLRETLRERFRQAVRETQNDYYASAYEAKGQDFGTEGGHGFAQKGGKPAQISLMDIEDAELGAQVEVIMAKALEVEAELWYEGGKFFDGWYNNPLASLPRVFTPSKSFSCRAWYSIG